MLVELRQSGGISGASRRITVHGGTLEVSLKNGAATRERQLSEEERLKLQAGVQQLQGVKIAQTPRKFPVSDSVTSRLAIRERGDAKEDLVFEVETNPSDPPPPEFVSLLRLLTQLSMNER